jgi:hypothetical protein
METGETTQRAYLFGNFVHKPKLTHYSNTMKTSLETIPYHLQYRGRCSSIQRAGMGEQTRDKEMLLSTANISNEALLLRWLSLRQLVKLTWTNCETLPVKRATSLCVPALQLQHMAHELGKRVVMVWNDFPCCHSFSNGTVPHHVQYFTRISQFTKMYPPFGDCVHVEQLPTW